MTLNVTFLQNGRHWKNHQNDQWSISVQNDRFFEFKILGHFDERLFLFCDMGTKFASDHF